MYYGRQIFLSLIFFLSFNVRAQIPVASITTTSESVILAGSTVQLDGTASISSLYDWKLVRTPEGSMAELTTPSPSMPSFTADRPGLYLVELKVGDEDDRSSPGYLVLTAVTPVGDEALSSTTFFTPALCALLGGFTGCAGSTSTFPATPGDYTLNIQTDSLTELSLSLNGQELSVSPLGGEGEAFSVAVSLQASNELVVTPKGEPGSSVTVEIVESELPTDMNAVPVVADLNLAAADARRSASGTLSVVDGDTGQTHTSEILGDTRYGKASLMGTTFSYQGNPGFKGMETVSILTYDDGSPVMAAISKVMVDVTYNESPGLMDNLEISIPNEDRPYSFRLPSAWDAEGDGLSYALVEQVSQGALNCQMRGSSFQCTYTQPQELDDDTAVTFSYKANDGQLDSNTSFVTLLLEEATPIVDLATGTSNNCVLFSDGGMRCWGYNAGHNLNPNTRENIGDNESPLAFGRFDIGESFVKLSLGNDFSCGLTDDGRVRCMGEGAILGFVQFPNLPTPAEGIDFGTDLKVVDIVTSSNTACSLFEDGRVKCWGGNATGALGLGRYSPRVGAGTSAADIDFIRLGGRAVSLVGTTSSAFDRFCAIMENGSVRCWGEHSSTYYGDDSIIGDNEHPESVDGIPLGESVVQMALGESFNCVLLASGSVKCWGNNDDGQLGLGHTVSDTMDPDLASRPPIDFPEGTVRKIVAGASFACALLNERFVRCWGNNDRGQLGLGHTQAVGDNELPSSVSALAFSDDIIDMTAGAEHVCVYLPRGNVRCWGSNDMGELGLGHSMDIGDDESFGNFQNADIEKFAYIYPVVSLSSVAPVVQEPVSFSAQKTYFGRGAMSYTWDFGDGVKATGADSSHIFQRVGMHPVKLTLTDTDGREISLTRLIRVRPTNYPPDMPKKQRFIIEKDKIVTLQLASAMDNEGDDIAYTLTRTTLGELSGCLGGGDDLICQYEPPANFTGTLIFAYRGNDGNSSSITDAKVEIDVVEAESGVVEVVMGESHNCALYENRKIKCWGSNRLQVLELGRTNNSTIGDDESLDGLPFVDVGGDVMQVAVGRRNTCAILDGGRLKCWGYTRTELSSPDVLPIVMSIGSKVLEVSPFDFGFPVQQVSVGDLSACAVDMDGRLICWGDNENGVLGLGNRKHLGDSYWEHPYTFPFVKIGGKVSKVVVGKRDNNVCALLASGGVRCWGSNNRGVLGLGMEYSQEDAVGDDEHPDSVPTIKLGEKAVDISVGRNYFCALLESGSVRCWGQNPGDGALIVGDDEHPFEVEPIFGTGEVESIGLGERHGCVVLKGSSLKCWGWRESLGNPETLSDSPDPIDVPFEKEEILDIATGASGSCIVVKNGDLRCWGYNRGYLGLGHGNPIGDDEYVDDEDALVWEGTGNIVPRFSYVQDGNSTNTIHFDAGDSFSRNDVQSYRWIFGDGVTATGERVSHTFGLQDEYDVTLTVTDIFNQSRSTTKVIALVEPPGKPFLIRQPQPFPVVAGKKIKLMPRLAGNLNAESFTYTLVSPPVNGVLEGCLGIDGASGLDCVYTASATVGKETFTYKAVNGALESSTATVEVNVVPFHSVPTQIAASLGHACALYKNKRVKCWGDNDVGQLGLGDADSVMEYGFGIRAEGFVDVGGDVLQVSVGMGVTCTLLTDSTVKCWGSGMYNGRGGDENIGDDESPDSIGSLDLGEPIQQISSGGTSRGTFTCALTVSGRVKCWGLNSSGQLGIGGTDNVANVLLDGEFVELGARAIKITTGTANVCALLKEGRVRCWGSNSFQTLGYDHGSHIGDDEHPFVAGNVPLPQKALDVVLGHNYSCALLEDKKPFCWGSNQYGNLGILDEYGSTSEFVAASSSSSVELGSNKGEVDKIYTATSPSDSRFGYGHTCVLFSNGKTQCWGRGGENGGIWGLGRNVREDPALIMNMDRVISLSGKLMEIAVHGRGWYSLVADGNIIALGYNHTYVYFVENPNTQGYFENASLAQPFREGSPGHPILARFEHSPGSTRKEIKFSAAKSFSHFTATYSWDFGDMMTGTGESVTHTYAKAGTYTVTLTATDSEGQKDTVTGSVIVEADNTAPFFYNATKTFTVTEGMTNAIDLEAGMDSEGDSLTYTLVGTPSEGTLANCLGNSIDISCDYTPATGTTTTNVSFTYKVNDGNLDSLEVFTVFLEIE